MLAASFAIALSLLAASPEQEPVKLAAPGFSGVDVSEAQATFFSDHFAQQLNVRGVRVTTASQIGALIGFERQRQLLGCKESDSACMAELAAALGVDGVVTGSVGKFDQSYQVNVSVVSTRDGRTLSAFSRKVNGSSAVLDALNDAADQMSRELPRVLRRSPGPASTQIIKTPVSRQPHTRPTEPSTDPVPSGGLRDWFWLPGGAGLAAGAGATALLLMARGHADRLDRAGQGSQVEPLTLEQAQQLQSEGRLYANVGYGLTAVGIAGIGVGAYFLLAPAPQQPVALQILPGPYGVTVSGVFR